MLLTSRCKASRLAVDSWPGRNRAKPDPHDTANLLHVGQCSTCASPSTCLWVLWLHKGGACIGMAACGCMEVMCSTQSLGHWVVSDPASACGESRTARHQQLNC
jgi:hypothetical protein